MRISSPDKRTYINILHSKRLKRVNVSIINDLRDVYSTCKLEPNLPSGWDPNTCTPLEPHRQHLEKFFFSQLL